MKEDDQDRVSTKPPPPPSRRTPSGAELNEAQYRTLLRWYEAELEYQRRQVSSEIPEAKKTEKA